MIIRTSPCLTTRPNGDSVLQKFLSTSQKLAYFESHILPKLAETLLHHLLPKIQHLIKPNSIILLQTIKRKSFSIINTFWEKPLKGDMVTKHAFLSLPSILCEKFDSFTRKHNQIFSNIWQASLLSKEILRRYSFVHSSVLSLERDNYCTVYPKS